MFVQSPNVFGRQFYYKFDHVPFNLFNPIRKIEHVLTLLTLIAMLNVPHFKIVFLGDEGVGKTSMIQRYVFDQFSLTTQNTAQNSFFQKIENVDEQSVILELWDVPSETKYQEVNSIILLNVDAFLVFFDITNVSSYTNAKLWIQWLKSNFSTNQSSIYLIANKTDLNSLRVVNPKQQFFYSQETSTEVFEASAKDGSNVNKTFQTITDHLLQKKGLKKKKPPSNEELNSGNSQVATKTSFSHGSKKHPKKIQNNCRI